MKSAFVGIDPGLTGAIAVILDSGEAPTVAIHDVPTYKKDNGGKEYNFYNMYKLLASFTLLYKVTLTLEQQQAMPGQGVSSTFQTGKGYGAWLALCWATTPNFQIVSPRTWKKAMGLTKDKELSRLKAISLYPGIECMLKRKKDHNRAEALLLAHYTRTGRDN